MRAMAGKWQPDRWHHPGHGNPGHGNARQSQSGDGSESDHHANQSGGVARRGRGLWRRPHRRQQVVRRAPVDGKAREADAQLRRRAPVRFMECMADRLRQQTVLIALDGERFA